MLEVKEMIYKFEQLSSEKIEFINVLVKKEKDVLKLKEEFDVIQILIEVKVLCEILDDSDDGVEEREVFNLKINNQLKEFEEVRKFLKSYQIKDNKF